MSGKNQRKAGGPPQKDINVELARWKKWLEEAGKSPISPIHVEELEKRFRITDSPDANLTKKIANQIGVDVRLVQYWFSHQRALHNISEFEESSTLDMLAEGEEDTNNSLNLDDEDEEDEKPKKR